MKRFFLYSILLLGVLTAQAVKNTGQQIFNPLVRSVQVYNPDNFMAPPVIRLGTKDLLKINFDIISDQHQYLRFRLLHCNADWQPSRLMESEYLDGFNEFTIDDYAYSYNTYVHFVNYNITLPDPTVPIIHSGNYLLQVFPENEPDDTLLQVRFSVSEEFVPVGGGVTTQTDRGFNSDYQQLFFSIDSRNLKEINPYQDLVLAITQNNRPETMRLISHPMRVMNGDIVYEHSPSLIFDAGNEYRRFETVKADYPGMHVDSVKFINGMWHAWLKTDYSRKNRNYTYDSTQHGRFKIDEYNSSDPDLSADYVMVHFSLDPGTRPSGNIYIEGDLTLHQLNDSNLMKYDWNDNLYHASIPLKQGSYNYQYVVAGANETPSSAPIDGNKYETQNEYLVQVYLRRPGSRGDRLIGVTIL